MSCTFCKIANKEIESNIVKVVLFYIEVIICLALFFAKSERA